jgi:hypothetical protein
MGWFSRKNDPISEKARALEGQIEALESEIKKLSEEAAKPQPRFRSSALPRSQAAAVQEPPPAVAREVDENDQTSLKSSSEPVSNAQYNDLGVRKYDLGAAWNRIRTHFKPPAASNPKLVNYLAAGSIQGLRPLRYEKRVARNRFIFMVVVLLLVLWGMAAVIFRL